MWGRSHLGGLNWTVAYPVPVNVTEQQKPGLDPGMTNHYDILTTKSFYPTILANLSTMYLFVKHPPSVSPPSPTEGLPPLLGFCVRESRWCWVVRVVGHL